MQDLEARLHAICEAQPFRTCFEMRDLATGATVARDAERALPSASTRKIAILMAVLAEVQRGRLDLAAPVTLEERLMQDVASGTYRYMTPGTVIPLRDVLVNMIITSDNVCTQAALERLPPEAVSAWCAGIGMRATVFRGLIPPLGLAWDHPPEAVTTTSAADQALLLDLIRRGAAGEEAATARLGCSPALCRLGLDILSWQLLKTMIPSLLPYGTKVAHKTGRARRGRMDAGIVFRGDRPRFILAAYTDLVPETMPDGLPGYAAAFATIGRLARACWDALD